MIYFRNGLFKVFAASSICSAFDADTFMNQSYDGQLETKVPLPPEGDYRAMFGEFTSETGFRTFTAGDQSKTPGKEFTVFQPPFVLADDPRLAEVKAFRDGRDVIVYHKGMFLDLINEGQLDFTKGKNVDLGAARDAVGQNDKAGWKFADLIGAGPVIVKIIHEKDKTDETKKFARVSRVVKIS